MKQLNIKIFVLTLLNYKLPLNVPINILESCKITRTL